MLENKLKKRFKSILATRWYGTNGYKHLLIVAVPLILSTGSFSIQSFVDRMFLSWYSTDALAAAAPTSLLGFAAISFFLGTSSYVGTFVAQYTGARRDNRVGPAMWQGIYFSMLGGTIVVLTLFLSGPLFNFIGHDPKIVELEKIYWKYLAIGGFFPILSGPISAFFSGRGKTYPVMWASFAATALNIVLNYLLIFGNFGLPEMGIAGAGLSTILSGLLNLLILSALLFSRQNRQKFNTLSGWQFEKPLFLRLIKFGMPSGLQFFADMASFSIFLLIIGRLGAVELAASNVALNISLLAFMPMIGMGIAVNILVGQSLGADKPEGANRATFSGLHIASLYMGTISLLYFLVPGIFIEPFTLKADVKDFAAIRPHAELALKCVAVWSLFDSIGIIASSALKGAGDTKFILYAVIIVSIILLIIPTYIGIEILGWGLKSAWSAGIAYIICLSLVFALRYRQGKWRSMRVIESTPKTTPVKKI